MGKLIDADELKVNVLKWLPSDPCGREEREFPFETDICVSMLQEIDDAPPVDAVPVVRCADCVRYRPDGNVWGRCTVAANPMRKKDYCSYGVRKDGGDETD